MLGIDGKVKPEYVEGDKLTATIGSKTFDVIVRGKVSENIIDVWIVEFEGSPPNEALYPYSCAALPHTMLTRREGASSNALAKAFDALVEANDTIWAHFGLDPGPYVILDRRESFWVQETRTFEWSDDLIVGGDPADWEATYSGDIRGTSVWSTADYTLTILYDGCGNKDAYVFANKNKVR